MSADDIFLFLLALPFGLFLLALAINSISELISRPRELQKIDYEYLKKHLEEKKKELEKKEQELDKQRNELRNKYKHSVQELNNRFEASIEAKFHENFPLYSEKVEETEKLKQRLTEALSPNDSILPSLANQYNAKNVIESIDNNRLSGAFNTNMSVKSLTVFSTIYSESKNQYTTTLTSCTCKDFEIHHKPCKHMLFLAYNIGLLQINQKTYSKIQNMIYEEQYESQKLDVRKRELSEEIKKCKRQIELLKREREELEKEKASLETINNLTKRVLEEKANAYPALAAIMSDIETHYFTESENFLRTKSHPALSAADTVRELRKETRKVLAEKKEFEYKLNYIRALFPNIDDVFEPDFNDADYFELENEENTDRTRLYLSAEEYHSLSVTERNQLALDRYLQNRKSKWQVGRDYEMYIGYLCEEKGYDVKYTGIIEKLEDMGRDLIATKGKDVVIIQCKNWSKEKTIHEKHVFQLFGTLVQYQLEKKAKGNVIGVFVTTTTLSNTAHRVAEHLGIIIKENIPLGEFPRIKCNINRQKGEKIYHLPFDQQYDSSIIEKNTEECYALTVKEAESKGFRRAMRHYEK